MSLAKYVRSEILRDSLRIRRYQSFSFNIKCKQIRFLIENKFRFHDLKKHRLM